MQLFTDVLYFCVRTRKLFLFIFDFESFIFLSLAKSLLNSLSFPTPRQGLQPRVTSISQVILLPQPYECQDYRFVSLHLTLSSSLVLGNEPKVSCLQDKHLLLSYRPRLLSFILKNKFFVSLNFYMCLFYCLCYLCLL